MSDVEMNPPVSGSEEAFGVAAAAPVAARGNNLVLGAPPSPAYAAGVVAAVLGRPGVGPATPVLLIAPDASLPAWAQMAGHAASRAGKTAAAAGFPSRAAHHLASGRVDLLVTTLATAIELVRRSSLRLDTLTAVLVAWPELELSDEAWVPLFADLPKTAQRIVVTADPAGTAAFVERYAWRAPLLGPLGTGERAPALPRLRVAVVRWDDRLAALAAVADLLDVDEVTVWTADPTAHAPIVERLAGHGVVGRPVAGEIPGPAATIFFDPPPAEFLGQAGPDRSVALVPPGTEGFYARAANRLEPATLPGPMDHAEQAILADRRAIRARIEAGPDRAAWATLAPLLDRWTASEVAVALQSLWTEARARPAAPAPTFAPRPAAHPKVWINLGRKDGATIGEVMAFVTLDAGVSRGAMGKLDLKDTFTLIEFASEDEARRAVEKLAGASYKGRRITARIDKGREGRRAP